MNRAAGAAGVAALVAAFVLAAALGGRPLSHDDIFWHLRSGDLILASGVVPTTDPFSYTLPGAPWVTHEWGFSVLLATVARVAGLASLVPLRALLVVAFFAVVAAAAWRRAREGLERRMPPAALPLLALLVAAATWAVSRELILRAALVGALCFALLVLVLPAFRRRPTWARGGAILALLLLWANLHSGVIFGLFLLAVAAAESVMMAWRASPADDGALPPGRRRTMAAAPHVALLAAASLVVLLNPNGLEAPLYPFRLVLLLGDPASPFELGHFRGGWRGAQALLGLLVAALALGLLRAVRRRRPLPTPGDLAALAVFAVLSWASARLALELVALAVPLVFALWVPGAAGGGPSRKGGAVASPPEAGERRWLPVLSSLAIALLCLAVAALVWAARPVATISPGFPAVAAAFLEANGLAERRIFHHQNWGGYLGWRLDAPVFWDGRNDVFAPLAREVSTTPFPQVAGRYGVEVLVLSPRELGDLEPLLGPEGDWRFAHRSGSAFVFVRRDLVEGHGRGAGE